MIQPLLNWPAFNSQKRYARREADVLIAWESGHLRAKYHAWCDRCGINNLSHLPLVQRNFMRQHSLGRIFEGE